MQVVARDSGGLLSSKLVLDTSIVPLLKPPLEASAGKSASIRHPSDVAAIMRLNKAQYDIPMQYYTRQVE